jgi:DNA-binding response OmpR family regulator
MIMRGFSTPDVSILVLDSEPLMRAGLRDALQSAGYLVVTAGDLGEAVDRVAEMRPDLLITRPYINSMPGRMAADYLRGKRHGLPVLIVSGFLDNDRDNVRSTVDEFHTFPPPFTREQLLNKVREILYPVRKKGS